MEKRRERRGMGMVENRGDDVKGRKGELWVGNASVC
jgi:hypothetical protein